MILCKKKLARASRLSSNSEHKESRKQRPSFLILPICVQSRITALIDWQGFDKRTFRPLRKYYQTVPIYLWIFPTTKVILHRSASIVDCGIDAVLCLIQSMQTCTRLTLVAAQETEGKTFRTYVMRSFLNWSRSNG